MQVTFCSVTVTSEKKKKRGYRGEIIASPTSNYFRLSCAEGGTNRREVPQGAARSPGGGSPAFDPTLETELNIISIVRKCTANLMAIKGLGIHTTPGDLG